MQEQAEDNRYASMLEALMEYLVFMDPHVHEMLTADWTLHLHIAERSVEGFQAAV